MDTDPTAAAEESPAGFYNRLRKRVQKWVDEKGADHKYVDYILLAPDLFYVLFKLSLDKDVPPRSKAKLAVMIAYFISPLDFIPEGIVGPAGYVDDVALAAYVLNDILNETSEEVVRRHWPSDQDVLVVIQKVLKVADEMVGSGIWKKLRDWFGRQTS